MLGGLFSQQGLPGGGGMEDMVPNTIILFFFQLQLISTDESLVPDYGFDTENLIAQSVFSVLNFCDQKLSLKYPHDVISMIQTFNIHTLHLEDYNCMFFRQFYRHLADCAISYVIRGCRNDVTSFELRVKSECGVG